MDTEIADKFKIRASQLSKIMTRPKDSGGITEKQQERVKELQDKTSPLTDNQSKELARLKEKRDKPEGLSEGAKTYCKQWLTEKLTGRYKQLDNKYVYKGRRVEEGAIQLLNVRYFEDYRKNTERRSNDFLTGEADIIADIYTRDTKCSFTCDSFPLMKSDTSFEYKWQGQGYLILWDKEHHWVDYCLVNTPWDIVVQEAKSLAYRRGCEFDEVIEEVKHQHIFDDLPIHLRVKSFRVDRDYNCESRIREKVELCRDYIRELIEEIEE